MQENETRLSRRQLSLPGALLLNNRIVTGRPASAGAKGGFKEPEVRDNSWRTNWTQGLLFNQVYS